MTLDLCGHLMPGTEAEAAALHPAPGAPDPKKGKPQLSTEFGWDGALSDLAMIRGRMRGGVDAVAIVREGRAELERRTFPRDKA